MNAAFFFLWVWAAAGVSACADQWQLDETYRLQPGDVLVVNIAGEEALSGARPIGPGGSIVLPYVGSLSVANLTLQEATARITQAYRKILRRPLVTVGLDEGASKRRVYVTGAVEKPGVQLLPFGATAAEAITAASPMPAADLSHVSLRRADGTERELDLAGLRTNRALRTNPLLSWDDQLYVPPGKATLGILGQVAKPGVFLFPPDGRLTLLEAVVQLAGGLTNQAAATALLIREGQEQPEEIDLQKLLREGALQLDRLLQPNDVILIPEAERILVAGEVPQPQSFYPTPGLTVLEALARAGGVTPNAELKRVQLRRAGQTRTLDLEAAWRRGEFTDNVALQPGDLLFIPRAALPEAVILGAVNKPGPVELREPEQRRLLRALALAEVKPNADLSRISIYRETEHLVVNAANALEEGLAEGNPPLQPGDLIFVPEKNKIWAAGAFTKPGPIDYDPQKKLIDYLAIAGLPTPSSARLDRGVIIRTRPDGTYQTTPFDVSKITRGEMPDPLRLQPGDIIFIEGKTPRPSLWAALRDMLWSWAFLRDLLR